MRKRSGCKACRLRHIKCVKSQGSEKCKYCIERNKPCILGQPFRFRPVTTVKFNAGEEAGSTDQSLEFGATQPWVEIPSTLQFIAPNTDISEEESETGGNDGTGPSTPHISIRNKSDGTSALESHRDRSNEALSTDQQLPYHDQTVFVATRGLGFNDTGDQRSNHDDLNNHLSPPLSTHSDNTNEVTLKGRCTVFSPMETNKNSFISNNASPYNSSAFSPPVGPTLRWPTNNAYEARLFHHYLLFCTCWIDICDPKQHFAIEVPKRAANFPVILNGILSLAARHLWLIGKASEDWSQPYVDKCLKALIIALEDPLAHWDENFLIAVILLRLHEEMGQSDDMAHHLGTSRILNSISSFAADGGLRESASWVSLRQHIYVSLTTQQPLNLSLENYKHSSVFMRFDAESWANRIIFLFAKVLQCAFGGSSDATQGIDRQTWESLSDQVDEWDRTKPWFFSPFHVEPDAGDQFNGTWPELLCSQGVVAVGLQYYHLCKIMLDIYSPNIYLVGLAGVRATRAKEAAIRKHIRLIIGYGISNRQCGHSMFQGSHILSACGAYVVDKREREACAKYLSQLQSEIGWSTDKVLKDLKEYVFTSTALAASFKDTL